MSHKEDNRIFVGGLSWETGERQLEQEFSRFGKVVEAQMNIVIHSWPVNMHQIPGGCSHLTSSVRKETEGSSLDSVLKRSCSPPLDVLITSLHEAESQ